MNRYDSFNGLRGYAAIGILLMHYLVNIRYLYPDVISRLVEANSILYGRIIPFFTMFVYMFFIVSAFSMCCGYYDKFKMKSASGVGDELVSKFDTNKFYSKRYARIWPFFALLVCIDVVMKPSINELYQAFADLTLAFNLLPNPDIQVIGVGWFLGLIFLFYMIFPWFVFLLQTKKRAWFAMIIAIVFHVIFFQYFLTSEFCLPSQIKVPRHNIVFSFPFFMAGGLLYLYRNKISFSKTWQRAVLLLVAILATVIWFTPFMPYPSYEKILFVEVTIVLWVMYAVTGGISIAGVKLLNNRIAKFLSGVSMEIFLCHMVIFRVVEKIHLEKIIHNAHALYWMWCVLGVALSIIFSWVVTRILFPRCGKVIFEVFRVKNKMETFSE